MTKGRLGKLVQLKSHKNRVKLKYVSKILKLQHFMDHLHLAWTCGRLVECLYSALRWTSWPASHVVWSWRFPGHHAACLLHTQEQLDNGHDCDKMCFEGGCRHQKHPGVINERWKEMGANTSTKRTHLAAPTFCHTHPGQNAWRFSGWGSCSWWVRGFVQGFQQQCEDSSSSRPLHPSWWPGHQRILQPLLWACTWRNARTLYWSGRPALVCGTWLTQTPEE